MLNALMGRAMRRSNRILMHVFRENELETGAKPLYRSG